MNILYHKNDLGILTCAFVKPIGGHAMRGWPEHTLSISTKALDVPEPIQCGRQLASQRGLLGLRLCVYESTDF